MLPDFRQSSEICWNKSSILIVHLFSIWIEFGLKLVVITWKLLKVYHDSCKSLYLQYKLIPYQKLPDFPLKLYMQKPQYNDCKFTEVEALGEKKKSHINDINWNLSLNAPNWVWKVQVQQNWHQGEGNWFEGCYQEFIISNPLDKWNMSTPNNIASETISPSYCIVFSLDTQ